MTAQRATLLTELALQNPGVFLIDWAGLQGSGDEEWAGSWTTDRTRLNREIMDACRLAKQRGWQIEVNGPINRAFAPLFQSVSDVVREIRVQEKDTVAPAQKVAA